MECKLKQCKVKKRLCWHLSADRRENRGEFNPYKICKKGPHYWSLCPDKDKASSPSLSVTSACRDKELLPLVKITASKNGHKYMLNCLLDSGSQLSYLFDEVA